MQTTLQEIRYETPIEDVDVRKQTVFLAGPTVRGNQKHLVSWRFEAVRLFKEHGFAGNLIIPEFTNASESDQFRYDVPVWEYQGLQKSHVIMFWIPRTKELIGLTTNHEHGYWMARERGKIVYGRPNDAYRISYLDIMWAEDAKRRTKETGKYVPCPIFTTLEKTVRATLMRFFPWNVAWQDSPKQPIVNHDDDFPVQTC